MSKTLHRARWMTLVAGFTLMGLSCGYYDDGEEGREFNGIYPSNTDWDFHRTVGVSVELEEQLRPEFGSALFEIRRTTDGGSLILRSRLSDANAWGRRFRVRLPQHEAELTVTVETRNGLIRHVVPIEQDGSAHTVFE